MKCDSFICDLQIVQHRFIVSLSLQKKGKLQNNIFGYKRVISFNPRNQNCMLCDLYLCLKSFLAIKSGRESYLIFLNPRPPNCGWSHLLCLFHDHFIKPKADRRIPLLVTKRVQHHTRHDFWSATLTLQLWVVSFAMFDSWPLYQEKSGKRKIPFLVTKRVKNHIWHVFLIHNPQIMGGFICYVWLMTTLSSQKLKNAKYRFWLQKEVKNSIWQVFLICDPQIVDDFIGYFWLKIIFDER